MRLSIICRIIEIEEGVIGLTPSVNSIILHMIRKPNSIILFYYSFTIIPRLKT